MIVIKITSQLKFPEDLPDDEKFLGLAINMRVAKAAVGRLIDREEGILKATSRRWRKRDNKHTLTVTFANSGTRWYFYCKEEKVWDE